MDVDAARRRQAELVAEHQAARRMTFAPGVMLQWESQTTIDHDQAEMMWSEEDAETRALMRKGYEALRPTPTQMTATVTIEEDDRDAPRVARYVGIEHSLALVAADAVVQGRPIGARSTLEAAPDTMHIAFDLPPGFKLDVAEVVVEHAALQRHWPLPAAVRQSPLG